MNEAVKTTLRILFFVLIQGLILNRMDLWQGYILPSLYIFGLLMLPLQTPALLRMIIAFVCGLLVDAFTNTAGLHASACVFMAFLQPFVLKILAPREGYESGQKPTLHDLGISWFIGYGGILTLLHHLWLFFVEQLRFFPFFSTLGKVILSSMATLLLMIITQYLSHTPKERRRP